MKPIIKWPGGKSREIENMRRLVPKKFDRFIEPFVGGGAVFFHLEHPSCTINDVDEDLISFYELVKYQNITFFEELEGITNDWLLIEDLIEPLIEGFRNKVAELRGLDKKPNNGKFMTEVVSWLKPILEHSHVLIKLNINLDFTKYVENSLTSKILRISNLEDKHDIEFDESKMYEHLETSIKSAYYTMIRDTKSDVKEHAIARYFFIREFCYGSMFRYNSKGKFNIPYGGINYNQKNFSEKVNRLKSKEVIDIFRNTEIYNDDFESFFKKINPKSTDFIFLDPPYDSDFKDYGQNPFHFDDQVRLANVIAETPAKFVMIINKSQRIFNLYSSLQDDLSSIEITDYEKTYAYNVRGRNERNTKHLLITNFPQETFKQTSVVDYF